MTSEVKEIPEKAILMDSCSDVHLFNYKPYLENLRKSKHDLHLGGINSTTEKLIVTEVGNSGPFENVYYCRKAAGNILSMALVEDQFPIEYSKDDGIKVLLPNNQSINFTRIQGTNKWCHIPEDRSIFITSVRANETNYPVRDIEQARKAKLLSQRLNYPSKGVLIRSLRAGNINNVEVTEKDVERAYEIYGPDLASVRGKTTKSRPSERDSELVKGYQKTKYGVVSVDIMIIQDQLFLVGVLTECNMTMGQYIVNRSTSCVLNALNIFKDTCAKHAWEVSFRSDNEKSIVHIAEKLRTRNLNLDIHLVAPGRHVPEVERKIRTIKERMRGILNTLPYQSPKFLIKWFVVSVISTINMLRTDSGNLPPGDIRSPREIFFGKRVDFKKDLKLTTGQYVEIHDVSQSFSNSMVSRTRGAIALCPIGNGSYKFWCLSSDRIVTRDRWTELPINKDMIEFINEQATKRGSADPMNEILPEYTEDISDDDDDDDDSDFDEEPVRKQTATPENLGVLNTPSDRPILADRDNAAADGIADVTVDVDEIEDENLADTEANNETIVETEEDNHIEVEIENENSVVDTETDNTISSRLPLRSNRGVRQPRFVETYNISVKQAIKDFGQKALSSIAEELINILKYDSIRSVNATKLNKQEQLKVIKSKMFLKEKFKANGEFEKLKSRLVAGGHLQDRNLYTTDDTSSPTIATWALFALSALAAKEVKKIITVDIRSAYLNAVIDSKEILMRLEPSIAALITEISPNWKEDLDQDGSLIVKLHKALYGCIESAKLFYTHLKNTLAQIGFSPSNIDPCVYRKKYTEGVCIIGTHVDDLKIFAPNEEIAFQVVDHLRKVYKDINMYEGDVHNYIGMTFDYGVPGSVKITMDGFCDQLLLDHKVVGHAKTPANIDLFKINETSKRLDKKKSEEFHSATMKLLYLAKRIRPDLLTAVSFLTTRVHEPTDQDYGKLIRILQYVNHTRELGLTLTPDEDLTIYAYCDASHGVHKDFKGHTGATISIGKGGVINKSSKQRLTSKSSTESEIIAVSEVLSPLLQFREFLLEQGYKVAPARLLQDNRSTIKLFEKGRPCSESTRHIGIRFFFAKDKVDSQEIVIEYCSTDDMLADILTKPLVGSNFLKHRHNLLNLPGKWTSRGVLIEE